MCTIHHGNITPTGRAFLLASHADLGREVWARWSARDEVYELFASQDCNDPIGECEWSNDAIRIARDWFTELQSY